MPEGGVDVSARILPEARSGELTAASPGLERTAVTDGHDVALLVDWENLKWSLNRHFGAAPNISSLVEAAREHGRIVLARAYADWTQPLLQVDAPNLYRAGIDPVYVPGRHPTTDAPLKNSADVRLAVDAVDVCGRLSHIHTYILVTGDGDLIHPLSFLRLNGRRVVIIAVASALSALLSSAADGVLLYERDIEPLNVEPLNGGGTTQQPSGAMRGQVVPPVEKVIEWIKDLLRARGGNSLYPFTALGDALKSRHGFLCREWYGVPLKSIMLRAQAAGQIRVTTLAGIDHAFLPDAPEPNFATLGVPDVGMDGSADTAEVHLESLQPAEQAALLGVIQERQMAAPYMTLNYIVNSLVLRNALPRLSREQIAQLVRHLVGRGILTRSTSQVAPMDGAAPRELTTLRLDPNHQLVKMILGAPAASTVASPPHNPTGQTTDPFNELIPALEDAERVSGIGYLPAVQSNLESRLGVRLRELGFARPTDFFREAARLGLAQIAQLPNGADVLLKPGEVLPSAEELLERQSILPWLGEAGTYSALRLLATVEDTADGDDVHLGSFVAGLQSTVTMPTGERLRTGEANRLLTRDLVEAGYVTPSAVYVADRSTGAPAPRPSTA